MKTDTSGIDSGELARRIEEAYGIEVRSLAFVPKGEEAYSYLAAGEGRRWFVKAYPSKRPADLETALGATDRLRREFGLAEVLPPQRTREGTATVRFGTFTVALFEYIDGMAAYEEPLPEADEARLARFFARLHALPREAFPDLPVRDCSFWFRDRLLDELEYAQAHETDPVPHRREVIRLLREGRADVLAEMEAAERLGASVRASGDEAALTHGDPTSGNVMKDVEGRLYVIDWGEMAFGPRERDLLPYSGEGFRRFLMTYAEDQPGLRLNPESFAYYLHEWNLQEIADYSHRLLFQDGLSEEEIEYSLSELRQYLPVRWEEIREGQRRIEADLAAALGDARG